MAFAVIVELAHPALASASGRSPGDRGLSDRERVAALFQGVALLAHLEAAGWHLAGGWEPARLGGHGALCGLAAARGRSRLAAPALLLDLLGRLFGPGVAGRGSSRRIARECAERWAMPLAPLALDAELVRLSREARFLLEGAWGAARRALGSRRRHADGSESLWVAGPAEARHRLLAGATEVEELWRLLASAQGAAHWFARDLAPEAGETQPLDVARGLWRTGQFERALHEIEASDPPLESPEAELIRAACLRHLGRFAASAESLRRLAEAFPHGETLGEALDLATVVFGNLGESDEVERWLRLGREGLAGVAASRAELAAAEAALDRRDLGAMESCLAAARPALAEPTLAWRWHRVDGERAQLGGLVDEAIAAYRAALSSGRRHTCRYEAGRLWAQLGNARSDAADLAGAERAYAHAVRLLARCEGPVVTTLALFNLAEARLRRGRLLGVEQILAASEADNERQHNLHGWAHDQELRIRFELVSGRIEPALERARQALARLEAEQVDWRKEELRVLAARALGWLGRGVEAATELAGTTPEAIRETLEPEERPALWALAGRSDEAWAEARRGPFAELWRCLLDGAEPPAVAWSALQRLDPFRAARLVLDCERLSPDCAPPTWQRRARATLGRVGAHRLAEWIGQEEVAVWRALERYAALPMGDPKAVAELFAEAGESGCRLEWEDEGGAVPLVVGEGGAEELSAPCGEGALRLRAPRLGASLRALFALALRDFTPPVRRLDGASPLVGECPALLAALDRVRRLAAGEMPVLLLGESGTGKELAAREVHRGSGRRAGSFVPVNCAALSETLIHSELFGHARGAFTGADRDRSGVFETARGGTVFLDEIGDLPLGAQGNLLRVLQEGEIRRLGESLPRRVDARVVAATHRDLPAMVRDGAFRGDLYFRLRVAVVRLPPLRERGADILRLAELFLERKANGGPIPRLTKEARARLLAHSWPGNVRELENALTLAKSLAGGAPITAEHLELEAPLGAGAPPAGEYHRRLEELRRRLVSDALAATHGRVAEAARRLGLTRQTLSYLIRRMGLSIG